MLYTVGFKYYEGCIIHLAITDGLAELNAEEAAQCCKIIYLKNGPSRFKINNREFVVTGACVICLNEQDSISFLKANEDTAKVVWFRPTVVNNTFTPEMLANPERELTTTEYQDMYYIMQFTSEATDNMKVLSLHALIAADIEHKIQNIRELLEKQNVNCWPCRSRSYLFEILFHLARQEEEEEAFKNIVVHEGNESLAMDVIYHLQSSYHQKITIEELSDKFHINRTSLIMAFKNHTGQSINQYLSELRLTMAATLLRDTMLSVEEISERSGFHDTSYFSRVFKKKLSCTPLEYRRLYNNDIH